MTLRLPIGAAGNHGFYAKWTHDGEEIAELKALFDADYRTSFLDLQDVRLAIAMQ